MVSKPSTVMVAITLKRSLLADMDEVIEQACGNSLMAPRKRL